MIPSVILKTYKLNNPPDVFISNYYGLVGEELLFNIKSPYSNTADSPVLNGYEALNFKIILGEYTYTSSTEDVIVKLPAPGTYTVAVEILYRNGKTTFYNLKQNIVVYEEWPVYDYTKTRILTTNAVSLPYTLEQAKIKPNEYGVADVFNSSILKLNDCIKYLIKCSTIIYNKTPTKYIGWLGVHKNYPSEGTRWYISTGTPDLSKDYENYSLISASDNFNDIADFKIIRNELYVADRAATGEFRLSFGFLGKYYTRIEYKSATNFLSQVKDITSLEVAIIDDRTRTIYIADSLSNKIHKISFYIDIDLFVSEQGYGVYGNLEQTIGGFGDLASASKFYSPTHIHFKDDFLYIVDANNFCIKKFTSNIGWVKTFFIEEFLVHMPICIVVTTKKLYQPSLMYILTITGRVYILDQNGSIYNPAVPYIETSATSTPKKIVLDAAEEFFYVIYDTYVAKYSVLGLSINIVEGLPTTASFVAGSSDERHNIYIADKSRIFKFIDIVEDFSILNSNYEKLMWQDSDLVVSQDEFIQDWSINKSLNRVASNVETFRASLHSRYGLTTVYSPVESLTYYTAIPINSANTPFCGKALEDITVGVNELVFTQVLNRNIEKIYNCIQSLIPYVNATYLTNEEGGESCNDTFCWSWKNTSCFNITLPVLRVCGINPVTFAELRSDFTNSYTPSKKWKDAFSECCDK